LVYFLQSPLNQKVKLQQRLSSIRLIFCKIAGAIQIHLKVKSEESLQITFQNSSL